MLLTTSVLKSASVPNRFPQYGYLLLTFSTTTYVHVGEQPDMSYEMTADIIGSANMSVTISKHVCRNGEIHAYQTSGANAYMGIIEVPS
jgi:hypothetical protein